MNRRHAVQPHRKAMNNAGRSTEDLVQDLCNRSFLADFVVRSPAFTTRAGQPREIADLLLPLRHTVIALQVRSRKIGPGFDASDQTELNRIGTRVSRAVNQIKTLRRALEGGEVSHFENLRGVRLPVAVRDIRRLVGVVVVDLVGPSTLTPEQEIDLYNGLDSVRDIPVHVFLRRDFEALLEELDTIPDFLAYLNVREQLMRKRQLNPFTCETDFLAVYQTQYPVIERCLAGKLTRLVIEPGLWEAVKSRSKAQFERRDKRRRAGWLVDRTIAEVHRTIGHALEGREPGSVDSYIAVVGALAELRRVERIDIGERMFQKAERADTDPKGFSYFAFQSTLSGIVFLFMSSREDRPARLQMLETLTSAAYLRFGARRAVGIATENLSVPERSHDFLYIEDAEFINAQDLLAFGEKAFGPHQHLNTDEWGNPPDKRG